MSLIIGTYAIAKNEAKHVDRWADSLQGMDTICCLDTGSDDGTQDKMRAKGVQVVERKLDPWRFDHARNVSMSIVPKDVQVLLWLDIDEVLEPGWREHIEKAYDERIDQYAIWYCWGHGRKYFYDKFHFNDRERLTWRHPVHEVLYRKDGRGCNKVRVSEVKINHLPDPTKSRGNYLPLLKLSVTEDPMNDRNAHYYARELYFYNQDEESIKEFNRHLNLPTAQWAEERCASCRYLAKIMRRRSDMLGEYKWLLRAVSEHPGSKEAWLELAQNRYDVRDHKGAFAAALNASNLTQRCGTYIEEDWAWCGWQQPDHLATNYWYAVEGKSTKDVGLMWAKQALEKNPNDKRLFDNKMFWERLP